MPAPSPLATVRSIGAIAAVFVAGLSLAACSAADLNPAPEPERDETGEVTEAQDADAFSIKPGDCLNETTGIVSEIPVVPCDDPHDEQAFFAFDLDKGDYPGDEVISAASEEKCTAAFTEFVGIAEADSAHTWYTYAPTSSSWSMGDREVLCVAYDSSGAQITGTLEGAAR